MAKKKDNPIKLADEAIKTVIVKDKHGNPPTRSCRACNHWLEPSKEDIVKANSIVEMVSKYPNMPNVRDAYKTAAELLLRGQCTFDPKWIKTEPTHYCGQWEGK